LVGVFTHTHCLRAYVCADTLDGYDLRQVCLHADTLKTLPNLMLSMASFSHRACNISMCISRVFPRHIMFVVEATPSIQSEVFERTDITCFFSQTHTR
jgi:hypothetical protein